MDCGGARPIWVSLETHTSEPLDKSRGFFPILYKKWCNFLSVSDKLTAHVGSRWLRGTATMIRTPRASQLVMCSLSHTRVIWRWFIVSRSGEWCGNDETVCYAHWDSSLPCAEGSLIRLGAGKNDRQRYFLWRHGLGREFQVMVFLAYL